MKWLTILVPVLCLVAGLIDSSETYRNKEFGIMENLTVVFLAAAITVLLKCAIGHFSSLTRLDRALVGLFLAGSIYFLGEEISWGQHYLGLETPEAYAKLNYQEETNLHNLAGGPMKMLFDRLPRAIVTAGIFIVGLICPFVVDRLPEFLKRYIPPKDVVLTAALAVFISVPDKILILAIGRKSGFDPGEAKELFIALFILLFSLHFARINKKRTTLRS